MARTFRKMDRQTVRQARKVEKSFRRTRQSRTLPADFVRTAYESAGIPQGFFGEVR